MNFRLTAILFGLLLVLALVLLGITWLEGDNRPADTLIEELPGAKADQIDAVEIDRGPTSRVKIVRAGKDKWEIVEPFKARADRFAVEGVVTALLNAKPVTHPEMSENPAAHGLVPPGLTVTLRKGDTAGTVNVGDVTIGGDRAVAFVTTSKRPGRTMAVRRSDVAALFRDGPGAKSGPAVDLAKTAAHFRAKQLFSPFASADDATELKLTAGPNTVALVRNKDGWAFAAPAGYGAADTGGSTDPQDAGKFTGVRPVFNALTNLQATTPEDFIEAPGDLKQYGLDDANPEMVRVEIKPKDGPPEVVFVGKKVEGQAGRVYAQVQGEAGVVKAQAPDLSGLPALAANPNPLRDRTLLDANKVQITAIDITTGGQTVTLRKVGSAPVWTLYGGPGDPQPADLAATEALVNALVEKRNVKDFPPAADANFAPASRVGEVKVWLDGIDPAPADPKADPKAPPKLKGEPIVLTIGNKLTDAVYVRRAAPGRQPLDVLMPLTFANAVAKTRLDLLDKGLKSFAANAATKVVFNRGAEVFELVKAEEKKDAKPELGGFGTWTFAQPERLKGMLANPTAVQDALVLLATQSATRYVDEQPTPEALAKAGLDPKGPRMRIAVTLNELTDKERVYEFGNDAPEAGQVFGRVGGRPGLFLTTKFPFERFSVGEFRDPTVLKFDPAKVTVLKLNGWPGASGPTTIELEKKDGAWVAKSPAGFTPDPLKVDQLLRVLGELKAKARVGEIKPEHAFDVAKGKGLEITVGTAAGPVALNVGAETDNGASYFVWLSTQPKEVVTVEALPLKEFKEKAGAVGKAK